MKPNILIIDDDVLFTEVLRRKLALKGYDNILVYHSGEGVIKNLQNDVDLVFLDYHLGDTNGIDLYSKIKDVVITSNIIMLSSNGTDYVINKARDNGIDRYIIKNDVTMNAQIEAAIFEMAMQMEFQN